MMAQTGTPPNPGQMPEDTSARGRGIAAKTVGFAVALGVWCTVVGSIAAAGQRYGGDPHEQKAPALSAPADSSRPVRDGDGVRPVKSSDFDEAIHPVYLRRHAVSIDQWLEWHPGFLLVRSGPPGFRTGLSRWGVGRGRALFRLNGVEMNDPYTGAAWLGDIPVSGFGTLYTGDDPGPGDGWMAASVEGAVSLDERDAPADKPETFVELSKGDSALRQRRVAFSSVEGELGIDLQYDELLGDGYNFDAGGRQGIGVPGFGLARSRHTSARLRGTIDGLGRYAFGFRRWVADTQGDLESSSSASHRTGHLATIRATTGRLQFLAYDRSLETVEPDSASGSGTRGVRASVRTTDARGTRLIARALLEETAGEQSWASVRTRSLVRRGRIDLSGEGTWRGATLRAFGAWSGFEGFASGVGGGVDLSRPLGWGRVGAGVRRSYRLPTLHELFAPAHDSGGVRLAGNPNLAPETAMEASVRAATIRNGFSGEIRATSLRVDGAISPARNGPVLQMTNARARHIVAIEQRSRFEYTWSGVLFRVGGGITWVPGSRDGFFSGVPRWRGSVRARFGGQLFKRSSALFVDVEGVHTGSRTGFDGATLGAWNVVNIFVSARLIDADLYIGMINALDEPYETRAGYLMLPRTMMYGLAWTIFE